MPRIVLNGQFVFQIGTWTRASGRTASTPRRPTRRSRYDLQKHKDLGFNTVRKHIKVEPERWFYWADRLGLLVWQDMPVDADAARPRHGGPAAQFETECKRDHRPAPQLARRSSCGSTFNEGWGQYDQARIADQVKA